MLTRTTETLIDSLLFPGGFVSPLEIDDAVKRALAEDLGRAGDVTSTATIPPGTPSRTMLVEIQVPNADDALLPGMYAQVDLSNARAAPPLLVPGDALIVRGDGTQVAVVRPDHSVHLQKIEIGRDYGDRLEVLTGLREGDTIIPNPGDVLREGAKVDPVPVAGK